jgi:hypothetical protein
MLVRWALAFAREDRQPIKTTCPTACYIRASPFLKPFTIMKQVDIFIEMRI